MSRFLKHVGKVGDRKVAVVFREVPGDTHMCLIVYTETLNQNIHDPLMACIESAQGQAAENLADALNRAYTRDGKIILQVLHAEGMLKRIQTEQVVMTPTPSAKNHVRLSELNSILDEMAKGEEAVKRLAELDASRGLQDPKDVARRMREGSKQNQPVTTAAPADGIMGDSQIAQNLRVQAERMAAEARGLLSESERLMKEAMAMMGTSAQPVAESKPVKKTRSKKAAITQ